MGLGITKDTQIKRARLYPDVIHLPLDEASLCVNCDTIHTGVCCPTCASTHGIQLSSVVGRMSESLQFKKTLASLNCGDTTRGEIRSMAVNRHAGGLNFLLLHLTSWLK